MRYYLGFNPKLTASKFKNAPVSGKKKAVIAPATHGSPAKMYKMSAGPLKETTVERDMRKAKEAQARWEANQRAKKELAAIKQAAFDAKVSKSHAELIAEENVRQARKAKKAEAKLKKEYEKDKRKAERKAMRKEYHEANRLKINAYLRARYLEKNGGVYVRSEETRKKMSESLTAKWAERKGEAIATDTTYKSQSDWVVESVQARLKKTKNNRNSPEACARVVERLRLRAEAKKSKSIVITITITDLNKS